MEVSIVLAALGHGWGAGPWFLLFPLFWLTVVVLAIVFTRRRWGHARDGSGKRSSVSGTPAVRSRRRSTVSVSRSFATDRVEARWRPAP